MVLNLKRNKFKIPLKFDEKKLTVMPLCIALASRQESHPIR